MKKTLWIATSVILLASCMNKAKEAAEYNDHIIDYQDQIILAFDRLDSVLKDSLAEEQQIDYTFIKLQETVKHGLLVIDSIGPFKRDPIYQKATRDLFATYDQIVEDDYRKFIQFLTLPDSLYTQQHQDSAVMLRDRIRENFDLATNKFIVAQEMFGKKYNIQFEQNP